MSLSTPPLASSLLQHLRHHLSFRRLSRAASLHRLCSDIALVQLGVRVACLVDAFDTADEGRVKGLAAVLGAVTEGGREYEQTVLLRQTSTDALFVCHITALRELLSSVLEAADVKATTWGKELLPLAYIDASSDCEVGESVSLRPPSELLALLQALEASLSALPRRSAIPHLIELKDGDPVCGVSLSGLLLGYSTVYTLARPGSSSSHLPAQYPQPSARTIDLGASCRETGSLFSHDEASNNSPPPTTTTTTTSNNLSDSQLLLLRLYLAPLTQTRAGSSRSGAKDYTSGIEVCSFSVPLAAIRPGRLQTAERGAQQGQDLILHHARTSLQTRLARALQELRREGGTGSAASGDKGSASAGITKAASLAWLEGVRVVAHSEEVCLSLVGL